MVHYEINYLAVLAAAIAYTVLGAIWYLPALFGNAWMKGIGKTKEQIEADFSLWKIVGAVAGAFLAAYAIARILSWTTLEPMWGACTIAFLAAVCFVAAPMAVNDVMEGRPCKLFFVNALYDIIGFVIMGIIIGVWQ